MLGPGAAVADDHDEIPFDVAELFFELNDTDGDLGIHALIDGEPWKKLEIEDFRDRKMLEIDVRGRLRRQGLTEIFFESAEPVFQDLPPAQFFRRFPPGIYEIEGKTLDGQELESEVELTNVMPAPAAITVNGWDAAEDCDADLPVVSAPVILDWDPITMSHPNAEGGGAAVQPPVPVTIVNYEVVVEIDDTPFKDSIILPPGQTSYQVPAEILAQALPPDREVKFEVLAREESFNQTAVESCFELDVP